MTTNLQNEPEFVKIHQREVELRKKTLSGPIRQIYWAPKWAWGHMKLLFP